MSDDMNKKPETTGERIGGMIVIIGIVCGSIAGIALGGVFGLLLGLILGALAGSVAGLLTKSIVDMAKPEDF